MARTIDQAEYDASTLESARIRAYARRVARDLRSTRSTVSHYGPCGRTDGWVIANNRDEGAREGSAGGNWEAGSIYFLRDDGELLRGQYHVSVPANDYDPDPLDCSPNNWDLNPMSDYELTYLDRPAAGCHYRKVKSNFSSSREEMNSKYYLRVHAKGVGMSIALKRLL